jgi:hypothetical protein
LPSWESGVGKAGRREDEDEDDEGEWHWRFAEGSDIVEGCGGMSGSDVTDVLVDNI